MGQKITLKIGGRDYPLTAESEELEQMMRLAAVDVDKALTQFNARFPDTSLEDKLVFVAVQETVRKLYAKKKWQVLKDEVLSLDAKLASYLEGIDE